MVSNPKLSSLLLPVNGFMQDHTSLLLLLLYDLTTTSQKQQPKQNNNKKMMIVSSYRCWWRLVLSTSCTLLLLSLLPPSTQAATVSSTVKTSSDCYAVNQNFVISFTTPKPLAGDLIAIVRTGTNAVVATVPICNSQKSGLACNATFFPSSGTLTIRQSLATGVYKASLLRSNKKTLLASSTTFRLQKSCNPTMAPSKRPTLKPIKRLPTKRPTPQPTIYYYPPTRRPYSYFDNSPTAWPSAITPHGIVFDKLRRAAAMIADLVIANPRLTPMFLRMGFHDCVQVCDGCIDLSNPDNFGLDLAIQALEPVVAQFESNETGITRADIWALATTVGVDVAPHGGLQQPVHFSMNTFGRVNCEHANTECRNMHGEIQPCSATAGPSRSMANPNFSTDMIYAYFAQQFGFDQRQTVAIMGAHSVGRMVPEESGIDAPIGWGLNNTMLQNEYYQALVGIADVTTSDAQITTFSPKWTRAFRNNSGTIFPDRHTWGLTIDTNHFVMLDADISLVRYLNPSNHNPVTGEVHCAFNERTAEASPVCPISPTVRAALEFAGSNDLWMNEFKAVLELMLINGYSPDPTCVDSACPLNMIPGATSPRPFAFATLSPTASPTVNASAFNETALTNQTSSLLTNETLSTNGTLSSNETLVDPNLVNQTTIDSSVNKTSSSPPLKNDTLIDPIAVNQTFTTSTVPPGFSLNVTTTTAPSTNAPVESTVNATSSPTGQPSIAPIVPTGSPTSAAPIPLSTTAPVESTVNATSSPTGQPSIAPIVPTGSPTSTAPIPLSTTAPVTSSPTAPAPLPSAAPILSTTGNPSSLPLAPSVLPVTSSSSSSSPTTTAPIQPLTSPTLPPLEVTTIAPIPQPTDAPVPASSVAPVTTTSTLPPPTDAPVPAPSVVPDTTTAATASPSAAPFVTPITLTATAPIPPQSTSSLTSVPSSGAPVEATSPPV